MTPSRTILAVLLSALAAFAATPAHGADPKPTASKNGFSLPDSTGIESDVGQAAVLRDRVTGEFIIIADPGDGKGLREISRGRCDGCLVEISTLPVDLKRYFVVVAYGTEPIGNDTVSVHILDPVTKEKRLSEGSRLNPLVEDINGDGTVELVLFFDTEDFQHPEAPVWPVIYALDLDGMVQRRPPGDPAYRAFMEETEAQFERFLHRLEAKCEALKEKKAECSSWEEGEIAKARKQLEDIRRILGR